MNKNSKDVTMLRSSMSHIWSMWDATDFSMAIFLVALHDCVSHVLLALVDFSEKTRPFFPKDVSSQGSSEDCWRISHHTYPTHIHHTTHIHAKRIPPIRIPPIHIRSTRIPPTRIRSTRIPPIRIHAMRFHSHVSHQHVSVQHASHQYVSMRCVSIQYVSIQKVCISRNGKRILPIHIPQYVSVQHVSHQYASIQCVSIQKVCISGNGNVCECKTYPCISLHQQEWQ